jgi:hypothetical protein
MRRRTPEPRRPCKRGPAPLCRPSYQGTRLRRLAIRGTRSPPWSVDEADPKLDRWCFIIRDANGRALAYVYFVEEPGRRAATHLLIRDEGLALSDRAHGLRCNLRLMGSRSC